MDNDNCFPTFTDFQYVSRKGKKKRKPRINVTITAENSDYSDTVVESIKNECDETNSNQSNEAEVQDYDDTNENSNNGIYMDGQLGAQPQIKPEDEENENIEFQEELQSSQNLVKKSHDDISLAPSGEGNEYNVRALTKHAETYELETFEKKALIIFNQDKVDGYKPRQGTEKDVDALKDTFRRFDFEVTEHKDLTKKEIFDTLETYFTQDFTDYGCVGIAILTHGSNSGLLRAKDEKYSEVEIINYFKVHDKPSLVTKPKFLIVQACRGSRIIPGVTVFRSSTVRTDMDSSKEPYILPVEADMLILHSSYDGSPSHRDKFCGSWFIQSLCSKINQLALTHDLESIITEVKREVAIDKGYEIYNKVYYEMQVNKQMPVMTSTLIRKLYLKKFGDPLVLPLLTVSDGACCNNCKQGSNQVLDDAPPSTPMLVQFGPCSCFLEHFDYMKKCFRYFVDEYPEDGIAESYLDVAETLEDGVNFNAAKERLAKAMCKHLTQKAKHCHYYKFLYFYKHF